MTDEHPTSDELLDYALAEHGSNAHAATDAPKPDRAYDDHDDHDDHDDAADDDTCDTGDTDERDHQDVGLVRIGNHVRECVACRVRLTRLQRAQGFDDPNNDTLNRVLADAPALDHQTRQFLNQATRTTPQPGEIWRVGTDNALLVWVRKIIDKTTIDVIPLVFDTEMADSESLRIGEHETPLGVPLAALTSVRTHIHQDVFLTRLSTLDISDAIEALLSYSRGGEQPTDLPTGTPIEGAEDRRIEFRQLVADLLGELGPVVYNDRLQERPGGSLTPGGVTRRRIENSGLARDVARDEQASIGHESSASRLFESLNDELTIRLGQSVTCAQTKPLSETTATGRYLALAKVHYIDTAVLVILFEDSSPSEVVPPDPHDEVIDDLENDSLPAVPGARRRIDLPDPAAVPDAIASLLQLEVDVHGVAITNGNADHAMLFTRADLRPALLLPAGTESTAAITITGHSLADTLVKYLDGEPTAWEELEQDQERLPVFDFDQVARTHATESLDTVRRTGNRSPQPAKKAAWSALSDGVVDDVSAFVEAARNNDLDAALEHLGLDIE